MCRVQDLNYKGNLDDYIVYMFDRNLGVVLPNHTHSSVICMDIMKVAGAWSSS